MRFHVFEAILDLLMVNAFIAVVFRLLWTFLRDIQRLSKSRRIQREMANYRQQLSRGKGEMA